MQDNVTSFMERLNFPVRDWHKLESCARSVKHALGGASGAYDEDALEEVGEDDQNVDNAGAVLGGRDVYPPRPTRHVQPRGSVSLTTEASGSSTASSRSSTASSSRPTAKARPSVGVPLRPHPPPGPPRLAPTAAPQLEEASPPGMSECRGVELRPHPPLHPPPTEDPQLEEASPPGMSECRGVKRPWDRPYDNEELAEPSGMCPVCKVPRAECFRPGDWQCPVCGQHNYPSKLVCSNYRCLAKRGAVVLCAPAPQAPPPVCPSTSWCDSCRMPRSECWKPNDWMCPWCKNHNYARKQVVAAECSAGWEWVCL